MVTIETVTLTHYGCPLATDTERTTKFRASLIDDGEYIAEAVNCPKCGASVLTASAEEFGE